MIFSGFWWKNSLEQIVGSSESAIFAMDPLILVSWFGRLLLDSESGREEEQKMEFRKLKKRSYQAEELES